MGRRRLGRRHLVGHPERHRAGLGLLARFRPDVVKVDMALIRGIDRDLTKAVILRHTLAMCHDLGVAVVAEGVETTAEYETLRDLGVTLFQGYYLAKPGFEQLPRLRADA